MKAKLLAVLGCLCCANDASANASPSKDSDKYVNLHGMRLFRETYAKWQRSNNPEEQVESLSILWELSLRTGTYLEMAQKLAPHIDFPKDDLGEHWAASDVISLLLTANDYNKAQAWIDAVAKNDKQLLLPLYPLIAVTPELNFDHHSISDWRSYQLNAYGEKATRQLRKFAEIMGAKDNYNRDQKVVLMLENGLLR